MRFTNQHLLRLAPCTDPIKYASIAGSHTNQAMRLWAYKCPHGTAAVASNGVLSPDTVKDRDPAYSHAIERGLVWDILSFELTEMCPSLVTTAQSAANMSGQQMQPESELQLCRKIRSFFKPSGEVPEYAKCSPIILRSKPPNAAVLPSLWAFMVRYGGGPQASLMEGTEGFVRSMGFAGKALGTTIWDALALEVRHKDQQQMVLWRHAVLKTLLCHGDSKLISANDIKKSMTNQTMAHKVVLFQKTLVKMKAHAQLHTDLSEHQVSLLIGVFEVSSVLTILQKKTKELHDSFKMHDCVEEAARKCCEDLQSKSQVVVASPWAGQIPAAAASSSSAQGPQHEIRSLWVRSFHRLSNLHVFC